VKLSVYHWNIASYRFNLVNDCLYDTKGYHIFSDNGGIQIIDLQTGKPRLNPRESREILSNISLLSGPEDPFSNLWPCNAFYELDLNPRVITYGEILEEVKSSLSNL
jgi:hypothetical protein